MIQLTNYKVLCSEVNARQPNLLQVGNQMSCKLHWSHNFCGLAPVGSGTFKKIIDLGLGFELNNLPIQLQKYTQNIDVVQLILKFEDAK